MVSFISNCHNFELEEESKWSDQFFKKEEPELLKISMDASTMTSQPLVLSQGTSMSQTLTLDAETMTSQPPEPEVISQGTTMSQPFMVEAETGMSQEMSLSSLEIPPVVQKESESPIRVEVSMEETKGLSPKEMTTNEVATEEDAALLEKCNNAVGILADFNTNHQIVPEILKKRKAEAPKKKKKKTKKVKLDPRLFEEDMPDSPLRMKKRKSLKKHRSSNGKENKMPLILKKSSDPQIKLATSTGPPLRLGLSKRHQPRILHKDWIPVKVYSSSDSSDNEDSDTTTDSEEE